MTKRRVLASVLSLALALAVAGALWWHHHSGPYHFETVRPGVLYRSGLLQPEHLEQVLDEYGIRTVVSLLPPKNPARLADERRIAREKGVRLVEIPLYPQDVPRSAEISQWLELFGEAENLPVLVHCKQGRVRTGMMVAIYEMELGHTPNEEALDEMNRLGGGLDDPKREKIREFLESYVPQHEGREP